MDDQTQAQGGGLKQLAQAKFGKLSAAENLLLESVPSGDWANCSKLNDKGDDPKEADKWGAERQIRAELVAWLCTNEQARKQVHPRGIQVYGADITGPLDLSFVNIPFGLGFQRCRLKDGINLLRAEVSQLDLRGSLVQAITADGLIVKNYVFLRNGFTATGEVRLLEAQIGGDFDCSGGTFTNEGGYALSADGINVKGGVFFRNSAVRGDVRLPGAQIGGDLSCVGGTFTNEGGYALNADGTNVKGSVFLRQGTNAEGKETPFSAKGEVNLNGAQIDGQLDCSAGHFSNPGGNALSAYRTIVKSSVLLRGGFTAEGRVPLEGAQIGGDFDCNDGNFQKANLDLTDASVGTLIDSGLNDPVDPNHKTLWPQSGKLLLDGFTYGRISSQGRIDVGKRLGWLELQPASPFLPRPYLQLAKVLQESGDSEGALRVKERTEELRYRERHTWAAAVESWILRATIGYGYYPLRALKWELGLALLGWIIYHGGYLAGTMAPTDKDAYSEFKKPGGHVPAHYPSFSPLIYSVENSIPLVKLGQGDKWQPDPERQGAPTQTRPATEFGYRVTWTWLPEKLRSSGQALLRGLAAMWGQAPKWLQNLLGVDISQDDSAPVRHVVSLVPDFAWLAAGHSVCCGRQRHCAQGVKSLG